MRHLFSRIGVLACCLLLSFPGGAPAAGNELHISYVKGPFNLQLIVMRERGILDKQLEELGLSARWHEINSGPRQAQALASGDLDIAGAMNSTTLLMAAGEGVPLRAITGIARPAGLFALAGNAEKAPTLRDLKGKTVSGPVGSVLHQLLLAVLRAEGMEPGDVTLVNMNIYQSFAALRGGRVDAALLGSGLIDKAEAEGDVILARAKGHIVPKLFMAASDTLIREHPERLRALLAAHDEAWRWIEANHGEAVALGAAALNVSPEEAERLFQGSGFTQRISRDDVRSMEDDMRFLLEAGLMRGAVDIPALILPEALEE